MDTIWLLEISLSGEHMATIPCATKDVAKKQIIEDAEEYGVLESLEMIVDANTYIVANAKWHEYHAHRCQIHNGE